MTEENELPSEECFSEPRTTQVIQQEYTKLCQEAGDIQYKIKCFQEELDERNYKMRLLNNENVEALRIENEKKAKEPIVVV